MKTIRNILAVVFILLALVTAFVAIRLARVGQTAETVLLTDPPDPSLTAAAYMDELCAGDYAAAYARMKDCTGLGLENEPESEAGRLIYAALRESWSYTLSGAATVSGMEAAQAVALTYLDVAALTDGMKEEIDALLAQWVEAAAHASDIYNDDLTYKEEIILRAYDETLQARLDRAADFYVSAPVTLKLEYDGENWLILVNDDLNRALMGGTL